MLYPRKIKDPAAVLDYKFILGESHLGQPPWLQPGETIQATTITVSQSGLTVESDDITDSGTSVTVWLSGGTSGVSYTVACHFVTSVSRTDVRSMTIDVQNR